MHGRISGQDGAAHTRFWLENDLTVTVYSEHTVVLDQQGGC